MNRRRFLSAVVGPAFAGFLEVGETSDEVELGEGQQESPTETPEQPDTRKFTGSGTEVVRDVDLVGGLTVLTASHDGRSNFIVEFVRSQGDYNRLFVNEIGTFEGTNADLLQTDTYLIDVEANGSYSINLE